jgi:group I intron endonuclease
MNYIYTLSDPVTNEIKYVGKTIDIKERYRKHIENMIKRKTYLYSWMKSLSNFPIIEIIDEVEEDWQFWEQYWISQLKTWGFKLTNLTKGGDGGKDFFSEQTMKKLREINTGDKNPFYGKHHTKESVEKIRATHLGKVVY